MRTEKGEIQFLGVTLKISSVIGTVAESSTRSVTEVHTVRPIGASVSTIASTTTDIQELWIRTDSGQEIPLTLEGVTLSMRAGQRVEAFYTKARAEGKETMLGIKNHTSGQHIVAVAKYKDFHGWGVFKVPFAEAYAGALFLLACIVGFSGFAGVIASTPNYELGWAGLVGAIGFFGTNTYGFVARNRVPEREKELGVELKRIIGTS